MTCTPILTRLDQFQGLLVFREPFVLQTAIELCLICRSNCFDGKQVRQKNHQVDLVDSSYIQLLSNKDLLTTRFVPQHVSEQSYQMMSCKQNYSGMKKLVGCSRSVMALFSIVARLRWDSAYQICMSSLNVAYLVATSYQIAPIR